MGTSAAFHMRRSVLVAAAAFVVVLAACGAAEQDAGSEVAPTAPPTASSIADSAVAVERRPAEDTFSDVAYSSERVEDDRILYVAPMVVVGTVREVRGPFWNSVDGQKWSDSPVVDEPFTVSPRLYREIIVTVETVIRDDYGQLSSTVSVFTSGGGEGSEDLDAFRGGRFSEGERVILFLSTQVQYFRDDMLAVIRPYWGRQSIFHVNENGDVMPDGAAEAIEARRSVIVSPGDPEPPLVQSSFLTLDEFVAKVQGARIPVNEEWERYRSEPSVVDAKIEFLQQILETGEIPEPPRLDASE
jgi:hypothetical protein